MTGLRIGDRECRDPICVVPTGGSPYKKHMFFLRSIIYHMFFSCFLDRHAAAFRPTANPAGKTGAIASGIAARGALGRGTSG
ncbi:hypothetical protein ABE485_13205 [Achromobacter spanius]|uniref:hypothetical protein n=1 Tax=Achromobacter spanius TaxID=217203 RepID=UPI00320944F4